MIYRSLKVEPVFVNGMLWFDISNVGNADIEPLMLEALIPHEMVPDHVHFNLPEVESSSVVHRGKLCRWIACYSPRGVYGGRIPILRPILTPSMGKFRPSFSAPIRKGLTTAEQQVEIYYKIHAIGYSTEMEERRLIDIPTE